ncbi:hypothetical protein [Pedobacter sp. GR22-10]|uniref:hypothetical protein n=1 Tax=Pedobacter sp. GR22-10 TaxID=2994472 RepID=UPI002245E2DE|nr:hypothetical protein [Pedobacter sp. GR22-10]MCX2429871.1 hypothetical protein [Pedobacter sp. GR22-10]
MGRYMTVELKEKYKTEIFIQLLNMELAAQYGGNIGTTFNTWEHLEEQADYINHDAEGLKQLPDWKRPISAQQLHRNFFWLRFGSFSFKLSGEGNSDEARDAVAVSKWIENTEAKFINLSASDNYSQEIVKEYLNYIFEEAGYDLSELWKTT